MSMMSGYAKDLANKAFGATKDAAEAGQGPWGNLMGGRLVKAFDTAAGDELRQNALDQAPLPSAGAVGMEKDGENRDMLHLLEAAAGEAEKAGGSLGSPALSVAVEEGDTLSGIGAENGKSVDELLSMNPELGDGSQLTVGQEIKLSDLDVQNETMGKVGAEAAAASPQEAGLDAVKDAAGLIEF